MKTTTFVWNTGTAIALISVAYLADEVVKIPDGTGRHYLFVTLPLLFSFIPAILSFGSLYMSFFFYVVVKDDQSRRTIKEKIGFFIVEK
jgi:hypothetical protein